MQPLCDCSTDWQLVFRLSNCHQSRGNGGSRSRRICFDRMRAMFLPMRRLAGSLTGPGTERVEERAMQVRMRPNLGFQTHLKSITSTESCLSAAHAVAKYGVTIQFIPALLFCPFLFRMRSIGSTGALRIDCSNYTRQLLRSVVGRKRLWTRF